MYERIVEKRMREIWDKQLEVTEWLQRRKELPSSHIYIKTDFPKIHVYNQKIYIDFVDILKAFDGVPRKQIWQSLIKRGIKKKLKNNIKVIYEVTRNYVR